MLVNLIETLRNEHRLKNGTDYAIVSKYDEIRLMCSLIYVETIQEVAKENDIEFFEVFTYV